MGAHIGPMQAILIESTDNFQTIPTLGSGPGSPEYLRLGQLAVFEQAFSVFALVRGVTPDGATSFATMDDPTRAWVTIHALALT